MTNYHKVTSKTFIYHSSNKRNNVMNWRCKCGAINTIGTKFCGNSSCAMPAKDGKIMKPIKTDYDYEVEEIDTMIQNYRLGGGMRDSDPGHDTYLE